MGSKVFDNTKWIIICKVVQSVLGLVISMFTARYLGPSNFGIINYASSLVAFVGPILYLGINNILVSEIVENEEKNGEILGSSIGISCFSSVFCIIGVTTFAYLANPGDKVTVAVCFLYGLMLIFQAIDMLQYWFQAKLLSKYTSIVALAAYLLVSVYKIFILICEKSVYWFVFTNIFDYILIDASLIYLYRKLGGHKLKFSFKTAKRLFSKGKYYIVSSMMVTIFSQTDKIMLKSMLDEAAVGYYSAAVACALLTGFVFSAVIDSFRPVILKKKKISEIEYESNLTYLYTIIIWLALLQSLFITIFSKWIVLILYGSKYTETISALRIVVWYTTFSYMGSVRNIWILAENKYKYLWLLNLSGAITNIILNSILIPYYGINGAAFASFVTQFFTNFVLTYLLKPLRDNSKFVIKAFNPKVFIFVIKSIIREKKR